MTGAAVAAAAAAGETSSCRAPADAIVRGSLPGPALAPRLLLAGEAIVLAPGRIAGDCRAGGVAQPSRLPIQRDLHALPATIRRRTRTAWHPSPAMEQADAVAAAGAALSALLAGCDCTLDDPAALEYLTAAAADEDADPDELA